MKITDRYVIDGQIFAVTSGSTHFSAAVNLSGVKEIDYVAILPAVGAGSNLIIDIQGAGSATKAESTNATTLVSMTIGSTAAYKVANARSAKVSVSTDTTSGEVLAINSRTYTVSNTPAATALTFGATAGTTAAGGTTVIASQLAALINSTISSVGVPGVSAIASGSTVKISVNDTASTKLTITATGAHLLPSYSAACYAISVGVDKVPSTVTHIAARISSCATAHSLGLATIRRGSYGNKPLHVTATRY